MVKLRGLPFDAGKMQIAQFFKGRNKNKILSKGRNTLKIFWVLGLEIESNGILIVTGVVIFVADKGPF